MTRKITAIWTRPASNKKWGSIFALYNTGEFLTISLARELTGYTVSNEPIYAESGDFETGIAFSDELYDFDYANYMISAFGGKLEFVNA